MRFALIATSVAAAVAVPFAMGASGPQMSGDQFLSAVRCTAYADITRPDAELSAAKWDLNAEARRQPAATTALARAEVSSIARKAVNIESAADAAMITHELADACLGAQLATGADSPSAV
jgi:hypothetical protein